MMASPPAVPTTSNANVRIAFQILSELDRSVFSDVCIFLALDDARDDSISTTPCNVIAAVLTSIVKGLASPNAYMVANAFSQNEGGLRGLALNFVRYQCEYGPPGGEAGTAVNLVEVVHHCSGLVKKWTKSKENKILDRLFNLFVDHHAPSSEQNTKVAANPDNGESFQKLLGHTFDCICSNTHQSLEDVMDFDYLWASTLNDPRVDTPLFGPDSVSRPKHPEPSISAEEEGAGPLRDFQCPNCLKEFNFPSPKTAAASFSNHVRVCNRKAYPIKKKRKRGVFGTDDGLMATAEAIRQVAKELAWAFSRISYSSTPNTDYVLLTYPSRKQRIINSAACIDLVAASLMAPLFSASTQKRRRFESGDINPRVSVEDEGAAALSTMFDKHNSFGSGRPFNADLREKAKASLLQGISDLFSSVTTRTSAVQHKEVVIHVQRVALSVLPFIAPEQYVGFSKKSSPASNLLSFISSHQLRERNLRVLKESYHSALATKVNLTIANTPPATPDTIVDRALKTAWFLGRLQHGYFIDSVGEFYQLSLRERKLLSPFASGPPKPESTSPAEQKELDRFRVRAIIYTNRKQRAREMSPVLQSMRCAVQLSRVKNPPTSEDEMNDLNEWTTAIFCLVSTAPSIKPSHWLKNHLESLTLDEGSHQHKPCWNMVVLPVIKYFLTIVADGCSLDPATCVVSDQGEYVIGEINATPGAILQLYYHALESIARRFPDTMLIFNEGYHSALFSLCYFWLRKATKPEEGCFLIEDIGDCPISFYKLVESFIQVLKPGSESVISNRALALPKYAIRILRQLQEMLLGMIWMSSCCNDSRFRTGSNFLRSVSLLRKNPVAWLQTCPIEDGEEIIVQGTSKDRTLVGYALRNLVNGIERRLTTLCEQLSVSSSSVMASKAMKIFKTVLHHRTDIFFDRHPDQLMLCSLYAACLHSKLTHKVSFQMITDAYMRMNKDTFGSEIPYTILHRIKNCSGHDDQFGDIVALYNKVFVPCVQPFWRSFNSVEQQTQSINSSANGLRSGEGSFSEDESLDESNRMDNTSEDEVDLDEKTGTSASESNASSNANADQTLMDESGDDENEKTEEDNVSNSDGEWEAPSSPMSTNQGILSHAINDMDVASQKEAEVKGTLMQEQKQSMSDRHVRGVAESGTGSSVPQDQQEMPDVAGNEEVPERMLDDSFSVDEDQMKMKAETQKRATNSEKDISVIQNGQDRNETVDEVAEMEAEVQKKSSDDVNDIEFQQSEKNGEPVKEPVDMDTVELGGHKEVQMHANGEADATDLEDVQQETEEVVLV